ncbi:hypothetical protein JXL19_01780 [bacterium]|nr:hypothetical protein [bacterium]
MKRYNLSVYVLTSVMALIILCVFSTSGFAQPWGPFGNYYGWGYPYYSYFSLPAFPRFGAPFFPAPAPYITPFTIPPVVSPLSRIGAATIIVTNPTAGTVSVVNPAVATAPAVASTPAPLLSLLATIYASALYEGALSTANPLLFALLQTLFF